MGLSAQTTAPYSLGRKHLCFKLGFKCLCFAELLRRDLKDDCSTQNLDVPSPVLSRPSQHFHPFLVFCDSFQVTESTPQDAVQPLIEAHFILCFSFNQLDGPDFGLQGETGAPKTFLTHVSGRPTCVVTLLKSTKVCRRVCQTGPAEAERERENATSKRFDLDYYNSLREPLPVPHL